MKTENEEMKNFLMSNGINKIFVDKENSIDEIIKEITEENNNNLNLEIEKLKKMLEERNLDYKKEEKKEIKKINRITKTIAISGIYGSGKSIFTAILAKIAKKNNLRVIILDFDIFNNTIKHIFNTSKYNKKKSLNNIIEINENISIFEGLDMIFNEKNKISYEKVKEIIDDLKEKYDLILIDTSSEINLKYIKTVFMNVQKIIFLVEPNMIELKKSEELLEVYIEDWEIPIYKFKIVLNKVNSCSIDSEIIKKIFNNIKIIEKINYSSGITALSNDINSKMVSTRNYEKILKKLN